MGKLSIPETVKVAKRSIKLASSSTLEACQIPIGLGENEIAIVLGAYMSLRGSYSAPGYMWLYKKSEERLPTEDDWYAENGGWQEDDAVFDYMKIYLDDITAVGLYDRQKDVYKVYPYPLVIIRDPSMLAYGAATVSVTAMIWYMIQQVTDAELTQLMVKDHA